MATSTCSQGPNHDTDNKDTLSNLGSISDRRLPSEGMLDINGTKSSSSLHQGEQDIADIIVGTHMGAATHEDQANASKFIESGGLKIHSTDFKVFAPIEFETNDDKRLYRLIKKSAKSKVGHRTARVIGFAIIPCIMYPIASATRHIYLYRLFGISLLIVFTSYFLHLFQVLFTYKFECICSMARRKEESKGGGGLFRVYSLNSIVPNWTNMSICWRAVLFEYQAIESISEFSAIAGGVANNMLLVLSITAWVIVQCVLAFQIQRPDYEVGFADISELIGSFGLILIGIYELDPFNKIMMCLHNSGALLGFGTVIGFYTQQVGIAIEKDDLVISYLIVPTILLVSAIVTGYLWISNGDLSKIFAKQVSAMKRENNNNNNNVSVDSVDTRETKNRKRGAYTEKQVSEMTDKEIKEIVTMYSLKCVTFEALFLFCGAFSLCLYLIFLPECIEHNSSGCV